MSPKLFIITVGVQYGNRPDDEKHPLGLTADRYTVIEAPDIEVARKIAFAIFDQQWAFIYEYGTDYDDEKLAQYHPGGEQLRIAWIEDPNALQVMADDDKLLARQDAVGRVIRSSSGFPLFDLDHPDPGALPSLDFAKPHGHVGDHFEARL